MSQTRVLDLETKIKALQEKKKKLEEKHLIQLAQTLKQIGADKIDAEILVGALLNIAQTCALNKNTPTHAMTDWKQKGKQFLTKRKSEKNKSEKQGGADLTDSFRNNSNKTE